MKGAAGNNMVFWKENGRSFRVDIKRLTSQPIFMMTVSFPPMLTSKYSYCPSELSRTSCSREVLLLIMYVCYMWAICTFFRVRILSIFRLKLVLGFCFVDETLATLSQTRDVRHASQCTYICSKSRYHLVAYYCMLSIKYIFLN
jgi:hypothetical protein